MSRLGKQAVVLGGSIGGIVTARALAGYFESVDVIERDAIPPLGEQRKGVPQGRHAHGLLYAGADAFERLFPGWTKRVVAHGGLPCNPGWDGRWVHHAHCQARVQAPTDGLLASRPLLEATLRAELMTIANVRFTDNTDVVALSTNADRMCVDGVRVRCREGGRERTLSADLVVDALGRGSRSPRWLAELGYPAPELEEVRIDVSYTTRNFERTKSGFEGDSFVVIAGVPPNPRTAAMLATEGDQFVITLGGYLGTRAPEDLEGFRQFAEALPTPDVGRFLRQARPVGEARTGTFPASRRVHYQKLRRFPHGYLVFGDAIASFNPIFGQGMTVAALEGLALQECLTSGPHRLRERFFARASAIVDIPWSTAVLNDLRYPEVGGKRGAMVRFLHAYLPRVYERGATDSFVARTVLDVVNLAKPPPALLGPRMLWHVYGPRSAGETALPAPSDPATAR
jgi:2-polyprenyl-6-methoxyphenol hydroxylase-like FAD-dependent oxidoreductase